MFKWLCLLLFLTTNAFAQVIDMRALSRQQGFKASPIQQEYVPPVQKRKSEIRQKTPQQEVKQEVKQEPAFRQTGLKIFQDEDEEKVMNFKIENPEFDKLGKSEQNDILERIVIKQESS